MVYQEINPSNWTYSNENDFIEGIFLQVQDDIGVNKSKLYSIETIEGIKHIWGTTLLDEKMAFVKVGDRIKITYKGLGEKKHGKNAPKIFKVEVFRE